MRAGFAGRRQILALSAGLLPLPARAASPVNVLRRAMDDGVIRVGVWLGAPPWGGFDAEGRPDGSEIAIARMLARDMNLRLRLVRLKPDERLAALLEDRCDVLAATMPIISETLGRIAFAAPHGRISAIFAAPSGLRLHTLAALAGKRVAMSAGTFAADLAHAQLPSGTTALFTPDLAHTIESLLLGEADVAVTYEWHLRDLRLARPDLDIQQRLTVGSWGYGLAARLGQLDLMRFLNTFLFLRGADGSLAEIHARYFAAPTPEGLRFY